MILDHPIISQRYFFPRRETISSPFIVQCEGAQLHCLKTEYPIDGPTMLHFHGNGEVVADYAGQIDQAFSTCGVNSVFAEYRGYGGSSGTPQLGRMLEDVEHIIQALKISTEQLYVFGRSVGSIYAIEVARRHPGIKGLIIESGIANPLQRLLLRMTPEELGVTAHELELEASAHINHEEVLTNYNGPLLLMHTRRDGLVDLSHAEQNYEWSRSADKKLKVFEHGSHNSIMGDNWPGYFQEIAHFVSALEA